MGENHRPVLAESEHHLACADLSVGEQLLIWAVRTRLEGPARLLDVRAGFRLASDAGMEWSAFSAFETWFLTIAAHCRRDLYLHRACCPALGPDEAAMLELVASGQSGSGSGAERLAGELVRPPAVGLLLQASDALGLALRGLGLVLPSRMGGNSAGFSRLH
jgi:hypothetical protein